MLMLSELSYTTYFTSHTLSCAMGGHDVYFYHVSVEIVVRASAKDANDFPYVVGWH